MNLADFEGGWRIDRRIANALGADAVFSGTALFEAGKGGLVMRESGEIRIAGQAPMRATRDYIWRDGAAGIEVFFDDGRFFHRIGGGVQPEDSHDCAPDVYQVAYDFAPWPRWSSLWQVSGPNKDYSMESLFERV